MVNNEVEAFFIVVPWTYDDAVTWDKKKRGLTASSYLRVEMGTQNNFYYRIHWLILRHDKGVN